MFLIERTLLSLLNLNNPLVHFGRDMKYMHEYLDSTLTWRKNIVHEFYIAKNDISHFMYSDEMSIENSLLLYKTVHNLYTVHRSMVLPEIPESKKFRLSIIHF